MFSSISSSSSSFGGIPFVFHLCTIVCTPLFGCKSEDCIPYGQQYAPISIRGNILQERIENSHAVIDLAMAQVFAEHHMAVQVTGGR